MFNQPIGVLGVMVTVFTLGLTHYHLKTIGIVLPQIVWFWTMASLPSGRLLAFLTYIGLASIWKLQIEVIESFLNSGLSVSEYIRVVYHSAALRWWSLNVDETNRVVTFASGGRIYKFRYPAPTLARKTFEAVNDRNEDITEALAPYLGTDKSWWGGIGVPSPRLVGATEIRYKLGTDNWVTIKNE